MAYAFHSPTRLVISEDAGADLAREVESTAATAVLVITDRGIVGAGLLEPLLAPLAAAGRAVERFVDVPGNPDVDTVSKALAWAQGALDPQSPESEPVVVAVGGGSAIDVAKAVSVLLAHREPSVSWDDVQAGRTRISQPPRPLLAVPTTAGTGSEVSHVAVIGAADGFKKGVVHAALFPRVAILDGALARSLPPHLTAATGMDALVHAVEAFQGRRANPTTDLYALGALRSIVRALPAAVHDPGDLDARRDMALAASWAGIAMDQAGLGLCHALCGPLSNQHKVHHGLGNALLLPAVLAFNAPAIPTDRWLPLRDALGLPAAASPADAAGWARNFNALLGLPSGLSDLPGVDGSTFPRLAEEALRMAMLGNNVRETDLESCLAVLHDAL